MPAGDSDGEDPGQRHDVAEDAALARRVQCGDRNALEHLARRYVRAVHAVAASFLLEPADVEDAAQETFLRALRAIGTYDPRRPFAPWLYQIARNVARNHLAARARTPILPLTEKLESGLPGPEVMLHRSEIRVRVTHAMRRLPERQRTAFYLSDVEGFTRSEIARVMGLSPGTVRSHIHHARTALRLALPASFAHVETAGE